MQRAIRVELDSVLRTPQITILERNLPSLFWSRPYFVPERFMLESIASVVQEEREALRHLMHAVPADFSSQLVLTNRVLSDARLFGGRQAIYEQYETLARRAALQIGAAQYANVPADSMAQLRSELVLLQRVVAARQHAHETWNQILNALDLESLEELHQREQQREAASVAARRARDAQAIQTVIDLVVTFGVLAAMGAVLDSGSPDERNAAESWLATQKENKRSECEREGREFSDGGPREVGFCVP